MAPPFPGIYQGFWQTHNSALAPFGQRIWVGITVVVPQPTAAPTATPPPNIRFWADSTSIIAGQCTTLRWDVTNVREVYVYAEGENWASNGVADQGSRIPRRRRPTALLWSRMATCRSTPASP